MKLWLLVLVNLVFGIGVTFFPFEIIWQQVVFSIIYVFLCASLILSHLNAHKHYLDNVYLGLQNFEENDFSVTLGGKVPAEYQKIYAAYNNVAEKHRLERQHAMQRERLLITVIDSSPIVIALVNSHDTLVLLNEYGHHLWRNENKHVYESWSESLRELPEQLAYSLNSVEEGHSIVSYIRDNEQFVWHISVMPIVFNRTGHTLYLLKSIGDDLNKREAETWKNIIKVISHELGNSIAPISSMCHSGSMLATQLRNEDLHKVFNVITKRVQHLNRFIQSYSELAKLKIGEKKPLKIASFLRQLQALYRFELTGDGTDITINADESLLEQALINLLKNAHETTPANTVSVYVTDYPPKSIRIDVLDSGPGMSREVIENALTPFYSTKHNGTGLGLALCREIIDVHNGKLSLSNRASGGFCVTIILPKS